MQECDKLRIKAVGILSKTDGHLYDAIELLEKMISEETEGSETWTRDFVEKTELLISDLKTVRQNSKFL